jgi:hypothetical protein
MNGQIDDQGTLRLNMVELREMTRQHPNQKVIVTLEILDGGDIQLMLSRYRNYILPKVIAAFRELGENYTPEQADKELIRHTTIRKKTVLEEDWVIPIEELDRELLKRWTDEITIFCSINLSLSL